MNTTTTKIDKLKEAYLACKNHPTRLGESTDYREYGKKLDNLCDIFWDNFPQEKKKSSFFFLHQFGHTAYSLMNSNTEIPIVKKYFRDVHEYMTCAEIYLIQVHAFIDSGCLDSLTYHCGRKSRKGWTSSKYFYTVTCKWQNNKWVRDHTSGDTSEGCPDLEDPDY